MASKKSHVVDGEASESDSEVEIAKSAGLDKSASSGKAFVITGEASESDDDSKLPATTKDELDSSMSVPTTSPQQSPMRCLHSSLLHQKLWESNVSLRATLEGLVKHTTDLAVQKLSRSDKMLLNVQESMRATNANLTLARARLKQLHTELEKANCSSALPTVKIK